MITKSYSRGGRACRVRFELTAEVQAQSAHQCGDFNQWDRSSLPMTRREDGSFQVMVSLKPGQKYRFCYLLDGDRWENDRLPRRMLRTLRRRGFGRPGVGRHVTERTDPGSAQPSLKGIPKGASPAWLEMWMRWLSHRAFWRPQPRPRAEGVLLG